ncbi:hypothetical protein GCM10010399_11140 [Dactylosporangium fulvum]
MRGLVSETYAFTTAERLARRPAAFACCALARAAADVGRTASDAPWGTEARSTSCVTLDSHLPACDKGILARYLTEIGRLSHPRTASVQARP